MRSRHFVQLSVALSILTVAFLALAGNALAIVEPLTLGELVTQSTLIVRGTVIGADAHWNTDQTRIYTYVTIRPLECIKGPRQAEDLVIQVPGGAVGDTTEWVEDVPAFNVGEETVLFLRDEFFQVVGWHQGKYTVKDGVVVERGVSVDAFISEIRRILRSTEAPPGERGFATPLAYSTSRPLGRSAPRLRAVPAITSMVPSSGPAHAAKLGSSNCAADSTAITIDGSNFGSTQGSSRVRFWSAGSTFHNACVDSWSDTRIHARVPGEVSSDDVHVITSGGTSNGLHFTVTYSYGGGNWPSGSFPEPMSEYYEVNPNTSDTAGELGAVQTAANTWGEVSDSDFYFRYGGTTSATSAGRNGHNQIMWVPDTGGSIAHCIIWWNTSSPRRIREFDVEFDDGHYTWDTTGSPTRMDVQNVATHELGHALILLDLYGTVDTAKTMYGFTGNGDLHARTLDLADIEGIRYIYPCLRPPGTPVLLFPSHGSNICWDDVPHFDWSSVTEASSYRMQVDDSAGFTSPVIDTTTPSSDYTPTLPFSPGTYYWRVAASNSCGDSSWSSTWSFDVLPLLPAPDLISPSDGSSTCDSTPYFDWSSVSGATSYQIQVADNPSFTSPWINATISNSQYTAGYPLSPRTWYWRVRAYNLCGPGSWSSTWRINILSPPPAPGLVSPLDSSSTCDTTPEFDWYSVGGATSYRIQVDENSGFSSPLIDTTTSSSDYTPASPLSPDTYYWRVSAANACGYGAWSFTWNVTILVSPGSPKLVSPSDGTTTCDSTPDFEWSSVNGASSYRIQVDDSSDFTSPVIDTTTSSPGYTPTSPLSAGLYYWRVWASNVCGASSWSSPWRVAVAAPPPAPGLISPSDGSSTTDTTPYFDWSSVMVARHYRIQVDDDPAFGSPEIDTTTSGSHHTPGSPLPQGTYYWHVSASNECGYGSWSSTWSVTILTPQAYLPLVLKAY